MRIVMLLLVADEADIVRENLDFHLAQGIDQLIVMENESTDGTIDILREYEDRGAIRLIQRSGLYDQGPWMTELARIAVEDEGADWVIPNDADEFWWPHEGTLRDVLADVPQDVGGLVCQRVNFVPRPEDGRPWWERMTLRQRVSVNGMGWPLPPKVIHRGQPELTIKKGNHVRVEPMVGETVESSAIEVLHFQIRSYAQFERGVIRMGEAHHAEPERRPRRAGRSRRRQYQLWKKGKLPAYYEERVVAEANEDVVEDPRLRDHLLALYASGVARTSGSG
jgi:hypothetical protein